MLLLCGCTQKNTALEQGLEFRSKLLTASGCSFTASVTADYGDTLHTFSLQCVGDENGEITFLLSEPDTLAGITGTISDSGGELTFDNTALCFPLLADDQLTPASAPWIVLKTLRSGYLTSACQEDLMLRLTMDDSYEEDALHLDIWLNEARLPIRADILYDEKRILSVDVEDFVFL